ncbi:MAG TPA: hypothetical protein VFA52_01155 [Candidatus Paceibacterota bacterium]|nr:hypothetical protein [Candidatus Paceibacterota bacterium]
MSFQTRHRFLLPFLFWLFPATIISLVAGLIYVSVQQNYRQSANDPQISIVEDASEFLASGTPPELLVGPSQIDIAKSLGVFLIAYDNLGHPLASSATLNGLIPVPPLGVFEYVQKNGEDRITWQPQKTVRIAAVITSYTSSSSSGFVLAGRSLREVENRESQLSWSVITVWALVMLISLIGVEVIFNFVLKIGDEEKS